jgi:hypothetical protein
MPLVGFTHKYSDIPAGASAINKELQLAWPYNYNVDGEQFGPPKQVPMWTYQTHVGLCIQEWERNGYDDSDFYMRVWNEEKGEPETIMFATTRGWSYPCLASRVDATPEVLAKYAAWCSVQKLAEEKRRRADKARIKLANKKLLKQAADKFEVPYGRLVALRKLPEFEKVLALFSPRKRNKFAVSMREQVLKWVRDPKPQYDHPLSRKQRQYL